MLEKIKNFRTDVSDISDSELSAIENEAILLKEYDHINKLLEQKDNLANKLIMFFISGTGVFIGYVIKNLFDLVEKVIKPENEPFTKELTLFVLNSLFYGSIIFVIIFTFLAILELLNRKKLIGRKALILEELAKTSEKPTLETLNNKGDNMQHFTNSIRKALKAEDWYGALSTALTLPDVCGRLETPSQGSKDRYVKWYRKWLQPQYTSFIGAQRTEHIFLHGEDCYALRCSYLHEGGSNIEEQKAKKALEDFHFITPLKGSYIHCNQSNNTLQLQVDVFCNQIADAVDSWYDSVKNDPSIQERMKALLVIHNSSQGIQF